MNIKIQRKRLNHKRVLIQARIKGMTHLHQPRGRSRDKNRKHAQAVIFMAISKHPAIFTNIMPVLTPKMPKSSGRVKQKRLNPILKNKISMEHDKNKIHQSSSKQGDLRVNTNEITPRQNTKLIDLEIQKRKPNGVEDILRKKKNSSRGVPVEISLDRVTRMRGGHNSAKGRLLTQMILYISIPNLRSTPSNLADSPRRSRKSTRSTSPRKIQIFIHQIEDSMHGPTSFSRDGPHTSRFGY